MTKINFLHVGKTAGSAISDVIRNHSVSVVLHPHTVTLADIPSGEKVIFFLRDPLDRFVSGFYSRQRCGRPRYNKAWTPAEEEAFTAYPTANDLAEDLSSESVDRHSRAIRAMRGIGHVRTSFYDWFVEDAYFMRRLDDIVFIGVLEHLDDEFEVLKQIVGLPKEAALPVDDIGAHRSQAVDRRLSDIASANIRSWYRRDYEFFRLCARIRVGRGLRG